MMTRADCTLWTSSLVAAVVFAVGCGGSTPAPGQVGFTQAELEAGIRSALEAGDRQAFLELYSWDGIDEAGRERQAKIIETYFVSDRVESIQFSASAPDRRAEYVRDGVLYRPNVPLAGTVMIRFANITQGRKGLGFAYGMVEGRLILPVTRREPVDTSDPDNQELAVVVIGSMPPQAASFEGSCSYVSSGRKKTVELSFEWPWTTALWGLRFESCTIRKTTAAGWMQVRLREGSGEVFVSPRIQSQDPIEYTFEP